MIPSYPELTDAEASDAVHDEVLHSQLRRKSSEVLSRWIAHYPKGLAEATVAKQEWCSSDTRPNDIVSLPIMFGERTCPFICAEGGTGAISLHLLKCASKLHQKNWLIFTSSIIRG
jgi:hypothetical protein